MAVKSTCCPSGGPECGSQHLPRVALNCQELQLQDSRPLLASVGTQIHVTYTGTHTFKKKKKSVQKKCKASKPEETELMILKRALRDPSPGDATQLCSLLPGQQQPY